MPNLSALFIHPVKSCAGYLTGFANLNRRGPESDREFLITDENGVFLTQREQPRMAFIKVFKYGSAGMWKLRLSAPDTPDFFVASSSVAGDVQEGIKVWQDICQAHYLGDEVARWLTKFLGVSCRLFQMADSFTRLVDAHYSPTGGEAAFADGFPFLIISDASLTDLNRRLEQAGKEPVTRPHFRSALWAGDCEPFAEDRWKRFRIGSVIFDVVKPCGRCKITTVNPMTGEVRADGEPLVTLATYRVRELDGKRKVMFGQNLVHRGLGTLRVGDEIEVLESQ